MKKLVFTKSLLLLIGYLTMLNGLTLYSPHCLAQTNMVGSLGGEVNVTPMGTATYSIPIELTPGTNGMQPNLAITYNSAMGRGMLGVGWTLSGFSSISRTQRNNYYDDAIGSINFDGDDRLALDGERLIKLSGGSYMAENAVYGTEIENFTRVTLNGSLSTPDAIYFTAVTDQGQIIEYGNTTNSKLRLPGGVVFSWMVNKVSDADGNYMSFGYDKDWETGEIWPVQINYTGNESADLSTYAKVQFQYTADTINANITYVGGNPVTTTKLLTAIVVKYGSTIVRQYGFEYDYDRSTRLTAVVLKDANGNELTRTSITWGEDYSSTSIQDVNGFEGHGKYILDYNGDGIPDLLLTTSALNGYQWTIKEGKGEGVFLSTNHSGYMGIFSSLFTVDWDGDGRDGFGYVYPTANADSCIFKVKEMRNGSFIDVFTTTRKTGSFFMGDFLGCGGAQFLFIGEPGFGSRYVTNSFNNKRIIVPNNSLLSVTDLNGNGKTDFQVVRENHIDVYEYDELTDAFVKIMDSHWFPFNPTQGFHGDFNGDGMMDYIYYNYTNNHGSWYLKISKGNEYRVTDSLSFDIFHGNSIFPTYPLLISDINGDGKDDIIQPTLSGSTVLNVYYSHKFNNNGHGLLFDTIQVRLNGVTQYSNQDYPYFQFADMNHDGKNDLFYAGSGNYQIAKIISFPEQREHDLMVSVTNGFGKTTSLEYQCCNSPAIGYLGQNGRRVHYPLVSKLNQPDGIGGIKETTLSYGYAVFDYERRQFLGFEYVNSYSNGTNNKQEYYHNEDHHHLDLVHSLTYYKLSDTNGGYSIDPSYWNPVGFFSHYETLLAPCYKPLDYGRFVLYSSSTTTADRLENSAKTDCCWLNSEGRVSTTTTTYKNAKSENRDYPWISRDSTVYNYTNVCLPNGKTVVKPSRTITWNKRNGYSQTPFHQVDYVYSNGRIGKKSILDSDGLVGSTEYYYNSFGLPITEIHTPYEMSERNRSFAYDNKGRFLEQETDELGHTSSATYNKYTGLLSSQTDANNLTTSYEYDALGRLTQIIRPDQTTHSFGYHWNNISEFPHAVYYTKESEAGLPETKTYYNILGRVVHTYCEEQGYHDMIYDEKGRLARQTYIPYVSLSETLKTWKMFTYDNYNRVTRESAPYTDLSYYYYIESEPTHHDCFVSVEDNIRNTCQTKYYDALGRLISVEDEGGTINYCYAYESESGNIRDKMTVSIGNVSTIVMSDLRGNRLSIQDPDAGSVVSTYNSLNQLVSRIDNNRNQTSYTYDLGGRTTRLVYSNGTEDDIVVYTYDNAPGKGIGKLASVRHGNDIECEFVYDTLGRLANRKVYDGNSCYEHLYAYDTLGRLQYLTYPDGFQIRHNYNDYGELLTIRDADNNNLIYAIDERNRFRQPLRCRFGNDTGTQYYYNSYGMLTGIKNGNLTLNGNVVNAGGLIEPVVTYLVGDQYRNIVYTYNTRGFIATRTDNKVIQSETYYYDELDRLESYKVNGVTAASFDYSHSGNITYNSKVGEYSYDNQKPHAVISIDDQVGRAIPPTQCNVTYNLLNRPATLSENGYNITLDYDASCMRRHTVITNGQSLVKEQTRISDLYELEATPTSSRRLDYIYAEGRIVAVHVDENSTGSLYYVLTDHLGNWEKVLDENKNVVQQTHFDPWGNRMSYTAWNTPQTQTSFTFDRGFTGHEHYDCMHIINANARLYDPVIGRFFSPDPFVQAPDFTQNFNRYSYCMNNPVMYSDPDGESFTAAVLIIGTIVGMYSGGILANGSYNPFEWDYSSLKTWGYMLGGGLTGLASAGAGLAIATTDIAFCNTLGMIASSIVNSAGTWLYTNGQTDFSINFGIASYNVTKNEWGYLGKKGNHWLQNVGYVLGGTYNVLDIYRYFTWDILSYQEKFSKLNNYSNERYGDITLKYGGKKNGYCAEYDPNTQTINIYDDALSKGWGWAKSSLGHEMQHYYDFNINEYYQLGKEAYYHKLDYYAYYNEVQNAKFNGLSLYQYRQVMNSCYHNARLFGMQNMPQFSNYSFNNYWSWLLNSLGL